MTTEGTAGGKLVPTGGAGRALWSHLRALVILGSIVVAAGMWAVHRIQGGTGDRDVDAAENIVRKASETPSTLNFLQGKVIVTDASWRLVAVEFDEQNTFGAMTRRQGCVVFEWTSDSEYRWNAFPSPVLPCDVEIQSADALRSLIEGQKTLNIRRETAKQ